MYFKEVVMSRDQEIKRLELYAKGLGIRVHWTQMTPYKTYRAAMHTYYNADPILEMVISKNKSKTQIILDFLHEIAHHVSWIYNNRKDKPEVIEALNAGAPTREQRKIIYEMERDDATYRKTIYYEVGIKIKEQKLDLDIAMDTWMYKYYWLQGKLPTLKLLARKKKELKNAIKS